MSAGNPMRQPTTDPATNLIPVAEESLLRRTRSKFFHDVLRLVQTEPRQDLKAICKIWLEATGAEWVYLWLRYGTAGPAPWELTAVTARSASPQDYLPSNLDLLPVGPDADIIEYAGDICRPVFAQSIHTWCQELKGKRYKVFAAGELGSMGCTAMLAVPLGFRQQSKQDSSEIDSAHSNIPTLRGMICSYFATVDPPRQLQDEDSYQLMAETTSAAIRSSFAQDHRAILIEMDALATKYLIAEGSIATNRKEYLTDVIHLIRHRLQVDHVSVFYRTPFDDNMMECLASTSLYAIGGGTKLAESELHTVRYASGQGQTGNTYKTGIPFISRIGAPFRRPDGTSQCVSSDFPNATADREYQHSWACLPISIATVAAENPIAPTIVGVLRCVVNRSMLKGKRERNFEPIQLQTIECIASHLAPVLETMATNIKRERRITIIKHDLYNPLRLLDAGVEAITDQVEQRLLPRNWEERMKFSLAMARNLAGLLSERENVHKTNISIAGDILIPLMSGLRHYAQVENGMTISFDDDLKRFPKVEADRELVERAFFNLVINAIKYGTHGTEIRITGEQTSSHSCLHIANEGIGVDDADREKIFHGEYRAPKARLLKQGLGLGLKIARAAMKINGGALELRSPRDPTIFTMIFTKTTATQI